MDFKLTDNVFLKNVPIIHLKNNKDRLEYLRDDRRWTKCACDHPFKIEKLYAYPLVRVSGFTNIGSDIKWCVLGYYELENNKLYSPLQTIYNLTINQCVDVMRKWDNREVKI